MEFFNFALAMIILVVAWRAVVLLLSPPHRMRVARRQPRPRVRSAA